MDFNLFNLVRTTDDVDIFIREIDILIDSLYRTGTGSFENVITKSIRKETAKMLETIGPSRSERKDVLEEIRGQLKKINLLKLTIAFDPSSEIVGQVVDWARKNVAEDVVLQVVHDSSIVGGAILEYRGKYIDISLKKKMEDSLNESI